MSRLDTRELSEKILDSLAFAAGGFSQVTPEMIVDSLIGRMRNSGLDEALSLEMLKNINKALCERFANDARDELLKLMSVYNERTHL